MKLLPHILLVYLAVGLQLGLGQVSAVGGARADVVLLAAVLVASARPGGGGAIAAVLVGLTHDLVTTGPIGFFGLSYGVAGLLAGAVARLELGWIVFGLTAVACAFATYLAAWGVAIVAPVELSLADALASALYTAIVAVFAAWPLHRMLPLFAIAPPRY